MATGISPLVSLATSMHAQPGVYALLLGSGVSTGAGLLTGWGVVRELVIRLATLTGGEKAAAEARDDFEKWWAANESVELGYATLLERLAPTPAARQGLLAGFFEGEDAVGDALTPSRAHRAVAELVRRGSVRVIVTTNFDRLMEQALEAIGISPQVIANPAGVAGMMPLAHAPATIVKLHGDYKDLGIRNTPDELAAYPQEWGKLLDQIFDEYGLVISGWSAEWDTALVEALERAPSRRYPLYWDSRSAKQDTSMRVVANRRGVVVPAANADDLFESLRDDLEALDRLSASPLTTELAVARLKRFLPDPARRIDLHDLVMSAVDEVAATIPREVIPKESYEDLDELYTTRFEVMTKLAALIVEGVWHDREGTHDQLWFDVIARLIAAANTPDSRATRATIDGRRIPALVAFAVLGITAMRRGREQLFIDVATTVEGWDSVRDKRPFLTAHYLHYWGIADAEWVNCLPRWGGSQFKYPVGYLLNAGIRGLLRDRIPEDYEFARVFRDWEYRWALIVGLTEGYAALPGTFLDEWTWFTDVPNVEARFVDWRKYTNDLVWERFFTRHDLSMEAALEQTREQLMNRFGRD
ncbi:MAG: SIR2 family protein [Microbacterium sp.]|nr:SIR2 family protein [Microbacterium sp.]